MTVMTHTIQANAKGTRTLPIDDSHLATIRKYSLFDHLTDSNGIVDEGTLDKLKMNIRSLITADTGDCSDLLDLCIDVIYHDNMKAFGLQNLMRLYEELKGTIAAGETEGDDDAAQPADQTHGNAEQQ